MSEEREPRGWRSVWTVIIIAGLALVAALFVMPLFPRAAKMGRLEHNLNNAKQTATALHIYASDNDGRFPESLAELVPKYCSTNAVLLNTIADGKTSVPWEYFPGHNADEKPRVIVFTSQPDSEGHRVVGYTDGWVKIEPQSVH